VERFGSEQEYGTAFTALNVLSGCRIFRRDGSEREEDLD